MAIRGLYVFSHDDAFGKAPAQSLLDRIHVQRLEGSSAPRSFADYKIDPQVDGLPAGITFDTLLG